MSHCENGILEDKYVHIDAVTSFLERCGVTPSELIWAMASAPAILGQGSMASRSTGAVARLVLNNGCRISVQILLLSPRRRIPCMPGASLYQFYLAPTPALLHNIHWHCIWGRARTLQERARFTVANSLID